MNEPQYIKGVSLQPNGVKVDYFSDQQVGLLRKSDPKKYDEIVKATAINRAAIAGYLSRLQSGTQSTQSGRPVERVVARPESILNDPQQSMAIGDPIPVVFCRRRNSAGGVLVRPLATESRFENTSTRIISYYHCVLGQGRITSPQIRDFRHGAIRTGTFSANYNQRAGSWLPGVASTTQSYQLPRFPAICGGGGAYRGLTTLEYRVETLPGTEDWRIGANVFIRDGMQIDRGRIVDSVVGPSDNVVDLIRWQLDQSGLVPADMIDTDSLAIAARFTDLYQLLFNGEIRDAEDLPAWLERTLPYFLLRETEAGGRFGLRPLLPLKSNYTINTDPLTPKWVFSELNIVPGSFKDNWYDPASRRAKRYLLSWRQQASETDIPFSRSLEYGPFGAEIEQHEMAPFATTEIHCARVGAYLHGRRTLSSHTVSLTLQPGFYSGAIVEGDIVALNVTIRPNTEAPGVFRYWYQVDGLSRDREGAESLQLSHFPVDVDGRSLLAMLVASASGPGLLLPPPSITTSAEAGRQDEAGRSSDTNTPSPVPSPIVPFDDEPTPLPPAPSPLQPPIPGPGGGVEGGGSDGPSDVKPAPVQEEQPAPDAPEPPGQECKYGVHYIKWSIASSNPMPSACDPGYPVIYTTIYSKGPLTVTRVSSPQVGDPTFENVTVSWFGWSTAQPPDPITNQHTYPPSSQSIPVFSSACQPYGQTMIESFCLLPDGTPPPYTP
jgi:hypothetical protein